MLRNLEALNGQVTISLQKDEDGFIERQCPSHLCEKVFKIKSGTGIAEIIDCGCPYCGKRAAPDQFYSLEQIEYARKKTLETVKDAASADIGQMFKRLNGPNLRVTHTPRTPEYISFHHARVTTTLVCPSCTCEFKVVEGQGFCPDCGTLVSLP
jgi:hypothetical protein